MSLRPCATGDHGQSLLRSVRRVRPIWCYEVSTIAAASPQVLLRGTICASPQSWSVRQRTQWERRSTLVQHCHKRHPAVPPFRTSETSLRVIGVSDAVRPVVRLQVMAKWVVLHLAADEASTYINVEAVTQVRQVSAGSTRISFADGTDVSVREDAPIVIAAFRRDSI
jgi:hypothetical protein